LSAIIQCPICDGLAEDLPNTIDGKSIHCERCDDFDVSGTVYDPGYLERLDPEERRQALENAKLAAPQGKRPMITTTCLGKIVFSGSSFSEVSRKADDWRARHPDLKIRRRSGPMGKGFTGPSLNDLDDWTVTIEYEASAARSNDQR
jgi:hypothetical protein